LMTGRIRHHQPHGGSGRAKPLSRTELASLYSSTSKNRNPRCRRVAPVFCRSDSQANYWLPETARRCCQARSLRQRPRRASGFVETARLAVGACAGVQKARAPAHVQRTLEANEQGADSAAGWTLLSARSLRQLHAKRLRCAALHHRMQSFFLAILGPFGRTAQDWRFSFPFLRSKAGHGTGRGEIPPRTLHRCS